MPACKRMWDANEWNPNVYDMVFDLKNTPSNVNIDSVADIDIAVNNQVPLSKKVRLSLNETNKSHKEHFNLRTSLKIAGVDIL